MKQKIKKLEDKLDKVNSSMKLSVIINQICNVFLHCRIQ